MLKPFIRIVDHQLQYNGTKSLFYTGLKGSLATEPAQETIQLFKHDTEKLRAFFSPAHFQEQGQLIQYSTRKIIELFIKTNQFLNFTSKDYARLSVVNYTFMQQIRDILHHHFPLPEQAIRAVFAVHYNQLRMFLIDTNGKDIFKKYELSEHTFEIVCAEYRPEFQICMLHLDLEQMMEPVLDIGCGHSGKLVNYLRANGIEAYGMDRMVEDNGWFMNRNWSDTKFPDNHWGMMISHMAFSNHFGHHLYRKDGKYREYMTKFTNMLHSLKVGGSFVYTPQIPFLEDVIMTSERFRVIKHGAVTTAIMKTE
ncbi:class I SAM-dependent methyltransferase [Paenibacillus profundus]|uniref:Class I SAM-dependent methyltransferase n=1 Tax=Paenibacillus profundus TaxID=1173085 RepID=A0ABS8YPU6_9BACL|nr:MULTISPECIES: class I SAM-dependent methyltransferase [Paenibacillus]MCE5171609.1 class I SAM-dependent methyltransferase [Paenibacillus profundus]